ncbi:MAG: hypothetical protein ABJB74_01425 [Gemmatimonas sp.]
MRRFHFVCTFVLALFVNVSSGPVASAQTTEFERQALAERRRLAEELRQAMDRRTPLLPPAPMSAAQQAKNLGATDGTTTFASRNTIRLTKNRAYFNVVFPFVPTPLAKGDRSGYYVWRWTIDGIVPFSLVLAADSASGNGDIDQILKTSRVRRCANVRETSAQACTDSVGAVVQQRWDSFRIEVKDTAIFNLIRRTRPQVARLIIYEPTGRAHSWAVKMDYKELPLLIKRK